MSHFAAAAAAVKSPLPVAAAAAAAAGDRSPLFCPKPRRPVAPLRCHQSSGGGGFADAGVDLLDLLLSKGEESGLSSHPPPLFCGSPPRRASNPVVHDSRFGKDCPAPPVPAPLPVAIPAATAVRAYPTPRPSAAAAAPSMSPRGGSGCARARFAFQPAAVRVEGFDCLDGGRRGRGHGITAMA